MLALTRGSPKGDESAERPNISAAISLLVSGDMRTTDRSVSCGVVAGIAPGAFVILGLVGTLVAYRKGRSLAAWTVLGLLLGPIALLAALVVGPR